MNATTAPASSTCVPSDAPGAAEANAVIAGARERIDALDAEIIALIRRRMAVSDEVKQARLAVGGPRLALAREMEILATYRDGLGGDGTTIAMTVLELCRGKL
ncbi:chorismate mutase [Mangrovactinospora gilvigrisea]|uniref:Chorismate mutase n=1 Tax=Mangrovactinospora gilvigrisea TaxID=1428644 RepID=A0A1J7C0M4_9ACTN|nr:chorismate mutase [Mangrovactinospora gilvigrisea]OIV39257.1 chorismate mutase [Mangrovactinospora gilvigrisea]